MPPTTNPLATLPDTIAAAIAEAVFQALMETIEGVAAEGRKILAAEKAASQLRPSEVVTEAA
jgi:hypothetical protein